MSGELHDEIEKIKNRNARVEADKAWETSRFRVFTVSILTYLMMILLMWVIGIEKPYLSALVPTAGFLLSTLSLRFAKNLWLKHFYGDKV